MNGGHKFVRCTKCISVCAKAEKNQFYRTVRTNMLKATNESSVLSVCCLSVEIDLFAYCLVCPCVCACNQCKCLRVRCTLYGKHILWSWDLSALLFLWLAQLLFYSLSLLPLYLSPPNRCMPISVHFISMHSHFAVQLIRTPHRYKLIFDKAKLNWWNYCGYDWNSIDSSGHRNLSDRKIYALR